MNPPGLKGAQPATTHALLEQLKQLTSDVGLPAAGNLGALPPTVTMQQLNALTHMAHQAIALQKQQQYNTLSLYAAAAARHNKQQFSWQQQQPSVGTRGAGMPPMLSEASAKAMAALASLIASEKIKQGILRSNFLKRKNIMTLMNQGDTLNGVAGAAAQQQTSPRHPMTNVPASLQNPGKSHKPTCKPSKFCFTDVLSYMSHTLGRRLHFYIISGAWHPPHHLLDHPITTAACQPIDCTPVYRCRQSSNCNKREGHGL